MKLIDISTPKYPNTFTMVDDEDFGFLNQWKWHVIVKSNSAYCGRKYNKTILMMHRLIMAAPRGLYVDHKNRNGLDNTRANLRVCTCSENLANSIKPKDSNGKFKGVYLDRGKFVSRIVFRGKLLRIGCFSDEIKAAEAYDKKAIELFGEFARPNFTYSGVNT